MMECYSGWCILPEDAIEAGRPFVTCLVIVIAVRCVFLGVWAREVEDPRLVQYIYRALLCFLAVTACPLLQYIYIVIYRNCVQCYYVNGTATTQHEYYQWIHMYDLPDILTTHKYDYMSFVNERVQSTS